ncbi:hypothetical protein JTB14_018102 [Gonioctena quinquepunctata]|nr:hypothetical protein JTB14_018102 [Gonioctena quinquepunctata]
MENLFLVEVNGTTVSSKSSQPQSIMSSDESDIEENLRNLKLEDKDINILLLGETGVGKSTFINAFANYLSQKYFDNAERDGLVVLIPSIFKIKDKKGKEREVKVGPRSDKNECLETGESATQDVKTYVFPVWRGRVNVRLIDTPGMGDTRGIEQDEKNCEYILHYLKTLKKIHAICFLFKPTEARKTVYFEYCLYQILSRLDKTACKNIFFLFTNTRGSDYGPGDTFTNLKAYIKHIQAKTSGVDISVDNHRFCFDNEAFKFLAAVENKVKFDDASREVNLKSWQESARQCWSFIRHLQKESEPYPTENLLIVNAIKKIMLQLSKVLADTSKLIDDNETVIDRLVINKNLEAEEIKKFKEKETNLVIDVEKTRVCQPILVCTSRQCADVYRVKGETKWHYKRVCHGTCYEVSNVMKEMIGCPSLVNCHAINKTTRCCTQCGCDFSVHMHVDYITKLTQNYVVDEEICNRIATRESLLDHSKEIIQDIQTKNKELRNEHASIQRLLSNVARFLQNNAIIALSDSYKEYIVYLINQKQSLGESGNKASVQELKKLLEDYEETHKALNHSLKIPIPSLTVDGKVLAKKLENLFGLSHNGNKIKKIYEEHKKFIGETPTNVREYVHKKCYEEEQERNQARGYDRSDRNNGRRNDNFSQKQRERKDAEKQRDDSARRQFPGRNFNRDTSDHQQRANAGRNQNSDPRYNQGPRMTPPLNPQGAYGGYSQYQPHSERDQNYPPREQSNYDSYELKVSVGNQNSSSHPPAQGPYRPYQPQQPYPPYSGHYPPQYGAYPPQHGAYPPQHGPPQYGAYPPQQAPYPQQYNYRGAPQPPHVQGPYPRRPSSERGSHYPTARPGNRVDNQRDRRDNRRGRSVGRSGKNKDGRPAFKPNLLPRKMRVIS